MAANTIEHGYKKQKENFIDINLKIGKEEIILSFRDDGMPFDPTSYHEEEEHTYSTSGIGMIKTIAKSVDYSRLLGLNSTIITVAATEAGK